MYAPYKPYNMVPKGVKATVSLDRDIPEEPTEMEKKVEVQEKPKRRRGRPKGSKTKYRNGVPVNAGR